MGTWIWGTHRYRWRRWCAVAVAMATVAVSPRPAGASSLDQEWGGHGEVVLDHRAGMGTSVVVQPDGRVLVAGPCWSAGTESEPPVPVRACVTRLLPDGQVDETFGDAGTASFGYVDGEPANARAIALDTQGRVVVAGDSFAGETAGTTSAGVARLLPDGALDASFAQGGATVVARDGSERGFDLAVSQDDSIVIVGEASTDTEALAMLVARFSADGRPDAGFGESGVVTLPLGNHAYANGVAVDPGGAPTAVGVMRDGTREVFALARLGLDGRLDPSFGDGGVVSTAIGPQAAGADVARLQDGRLVVSGVTSDRGDDGDIAVARYTADGRLDTGFGEGGVIVTPATAGDDRANGLDVRDDGSVAVVGTTSTTRAVAYDATGTDVLVVRYTPTGELDPSFDGDGVAVTQAACALSSDAIDAVFQPDGRLLVAGSARSDEPQIALLRYAASSGDTPRTVQCLGGRDRVMTAVSVSRAQFGAQSTDAAVIARHDAFPDALAGAPLASHVDGPLLLTPPDGLDSRTEAELARVLRPGATVYLLGGDEALSAAVESRLEDIGFVPRRLAGGDRFETAVTVARTIGEPGVVFVASGLDFADAVSAAAPAAASRGVVVLSAGRTLPPATVEFLRDHQQVPRYAVGGPAAAADPEATPLVGGDRYETAVRVAEAFFPAPTRVGVTRGDDFADALAGGAHLAGMSAPMLLTRSGDLPQPLRHYAAEHAPSVTTAVVYGGAEAVHAGVRSELATLID